MMKSRFNGKNGGIICLVRRLNAPILEHLPKPDTEELIKFLQNGK